MTASGGGDQSVLEVRSDNFSNGVLTKPPYPCIDRILRRAFMQCCLDIPIRFFSF